MSTARHNSVQVSLTLQQVVHFCCVLAQNKKYIYCHLQCFWRKCYSSWICYSASTLEKRHISILSTRNVIRTFFWTSAPPTQLETSRTFFDSVETRPGPDNEHKKYLKYKYTYKNAGFCIKNKTPGKAFTLA